MKMRKAMFVIACLLLAAGAYALPTSPRAEIGNTGAAEPVRLETFVQQQQLNLGLLVSRSRVARKNTTDELADPNGSFFDIGGSGRGSGYRGSNSNGSGASWRGGDAPPYDGSLKDALNGAGSAGGSNNGSGSNGVPVVPAPGAILLGGAGIGIVGWLRRRKMLDQ